MRRRFEKTLPGQKQLKFARFRADKLFMDDITKSISNYWVTGTSNRSIAFRKTPRSSVPAWLVAGLLLQCCVGSALGASSTVTLNNYDALQPIFYLTSGTLAPVGTYVELLGGPIGGPLAPVASSSNGAGEFRIDNPGYFDAGIGVIPGVTANGLAEFQLRAWTSADSYADATYRGQTTIWQQLTGSWDSNAAPPQPPSGPPAQIPSAIVIAPAGAVLTLLSSPASGGQATANPPPGSGGQYVKGTSVTLTASAAGGYRFASWSGVPAGAENRNPLSGFIMDGDKTVTAKFVLVLQIVTQPGSVSIPIGASASFSVVATPPGSLQYQWRKNGNNLADSATCTGTRTATLVVSNAQREDAGSYDVVVTLGADSVTSQAATLTVIAPVRVAIGRSAAGGGLVLSLLDGTPGSQYAIEATDNFLTWTPVFTGTANVAGTFVWPIPFEASRSQRYFRAAAAPSIDSLKATIRLNNWDSNQAIYYQTLGSLAQVGTMVELMAGPVGGSMSPVYSSSTGNPFVFTLGNPGYFDAGIGIVPLLAANAWAQFQLLAWQGAATYDAAPVRGQSTIFQEQTGSWNSQAIPPAPPTGPALNLTAPVVIQNVMP